MGVLNLWVAFNFSTDTWVNFKLFGGMGLMIAFVDRAGAVAGEVPARRRREEARRSGARDRQARLKADMLYAIICEDLPGRARAQARQSRPRTSSA